MKDELLEKLQILRDRVMRPMSIDRGYSCPEHNAAVGGAPDSAHLYGMAADVADVDGALKRYCSESVLEDLGLWAEEYDKTPTWIHLQVRPASRRIFKI